MNNERVKILEVTWPQFLYTSYKPSMSYDLENKYDSHEFVLPKIVRMSIAIGNGIKVK